VEKRFHTISGEVDSEAQLGTVAVESLHEPSYAPPDDRWLSIMRVLWSQRRTIGKAGLSVAAIVLLASLFSRNTYRSTTQVLPSSEQGSPTLAMMSSLAGNVGGSGLGAMVAGDMGIHSNGDLAVAVLHSRSALESIVNRFDLRSEYGSRWLRSRASVPDAAKELEFNTEISQDRKSGVITISVVDHDPNRAQALANGYVDELNRLFASLNTSAAARERQFLEQRLVGVKQDLDEAVEQLSQFSSKNKTFDPADQGKAMVSAVATLEGELIAAESQLRGLQAIYAPDNVRVRALQARVTELRKQLSGVSGSAEPISSNDFSATANGNPADQPLPSLKELPLLGGTYLNLYRRAKIQETLYEALTQQYESAKVQEAKEIPTVRVLDPGDVPPRKWGPHRGIQTVLGLLLGILAGCVWVTARDQWQRWNDRDPRKVFLTEVMVHVAGTRVSRWLHSIAAKWRSRVQHYPPKWPQSESR
jgi:capsule polysaccharide export protein KpsE/RkpR